MGEGDRGDGGWMGGMGDGWGERRISCIPLQGDTSQSLGAVQPVFLGDVNHQGAQPRSDQVLRQKGNAGISDNNPLQSSHGSPPPKAVYWRLL